MFVDYNITADMFTVAVYKDDKLITSEPLILDTPLFKDTYQPGFPALSIVPVALDKSETRITWDNMGKTVFLTIDDEESGGVDG